MKYEYMGISLRDSLGKIIDNINSKNTFFIKSVGALEYNPNSNARIYIYIDKILKIVVLDEDYQIDEKIKIGEKLTTEIIEDYELYYDDNEELYFSKCYKELILDTGISDTILGVSFDSQYELEYKSQKKWEGNFLKNINLEEIYWEFYNNKTLEIDIDKREVYGELNQYKFTFNMLTKEVKNIQNLNAEDDISR